MGVKCLVCWMASTFNVPLFKAKRKTSILNLFIKQLHLLSISNMVQKDHKSAVYTIEHL